MDKKAFGKQLQRYRERAGYSQEALAEQIECSTIFIPILNVAKISQLDTLVKLANALDISVDILLGKELKNYTSEKLKYIESQLKNLPSLEQQKVLDIMDSVVAVELSYHNEKGLQKKMLILVFDTSEDRDKFVILYETYGKTIYYTLSRYNFDEHTKEDLSRIFT